MFLQTEATLFCIISKWLEDIPNRRTSSSAKIMHFELVVKDRILSFCRNYSSKLQFIWVSKTEIYKCTRQICNMDVWNWSRGISLYFIGLNILNILFVFYLETTKKYDIPCERDLFNGLPKQSLKCTFRKLSISFSLFSILKWNRKLLFPNYLFLQTIKLFAQSQQVIFKLMNTSAFFQVIIMFQTIT